MSKMQDFMCQRPKKKMNKKKITEKKKARDGK